MKLALLGKSLSHSFSKSYFENKFQNKQLPNYSYHNLDLSNLDGLLELIKSENLDGLNVTKPYKELVIPLLNNLDDTAKVIGAVNCIKVIKDHGNFSLVGYNTDYYGFGQSIKPFLEPIHQKALILGTGGASKAVAYSLKNIGVDVFFVTSSEKKTANSFYYNELNEHIFKAFKLVVNCTPLGMFPSIKECPDIPYEFLTSEHLLYDLIYNPEETLFLQKGKAQGAVTINGLNMLKLQAEKAWEIWHS